NNCQCLTTRSSAAGASCQPAGTTGSVSSLSPSRTLQVDIQERGHLVIVLRYSDLHQRLANGFHSLHHILANSLAGLSRRLQVSGTTPGGLYWYVRASDQPLVYRSVIIW